MDNPNVSQVNINIDSRIGATPYLDYIITFTYNTYRLEQDANGNMVKVQGRAGVENTTKLLRGNQKGNFNTNLLFEPGEYLDGYVKMKVELKAVDDVDSIIDRELTGRPASFVETARRIAKGRPGIDIDDALFDASSGNINIILESKAAINIVSILPDSPSQPVGSYFKREKFDPNNVYYDTHPRNENYVRIFSDRVLTNTTKNNNIKIICTYDTCYHQMIDGNCIKEPHKKDVITEFILSDSKSVCKLVLPVKEFFDGPIKIEVWTRHFDNDDFPWVKQIGDAKLELRQSDRHQGLYFGDVILEGTTAFDGHVYFAQDSPCKPIGQYYQKDDNLNEKEYFLVDILMLAQTQNNEKNVKVKLTFTTCIHTIEKNGDTIENPGRTIEFEELYQDEYPARHHRFYIHLNKGESIDEPAKLQAWARFYEKDDYPWVRNIDDALLDTSSGKIEIILTGSTFEGIYDTPEVCIAKDSPSKPIGSYYQNDSSDTSIKCYPDSYYEREDIRRKAIREGLRKTSVDPDLVLYNDTLYNEDKAPDKSLVITAGECYILRNQNKPISKESIYVRGGGFQGIYPGAIVFADKHLSEGDPIPLSNVDKAPFEIYGDFTSGKNTRKSINTSDAGKVRDTISEMLRELLGSNYRPSGQLKYANMTYSSQKDMMYGMKVDAKFCGSEVTVNADINTSESNFVHDSSLNENFYTIRLNDNYRNDISKLFGKTVTWDQIKENSTVNGVLQPLAIITSVTYGRSVHFLREFSTSSFHYKGDQSHTGHGIDVSTEQDIANNITATNVQIISLGDNAAGKKIMKDSGGQASLKSFSEKQIEDALAQTSEFSEKSLGLPMSYTIELISGQTPGVTITPTFDGNTVSRTYLRCPRSVQVFVTNKAYCTANEENVRVLIDYTVFKIGTGPDGKPIKIVSGHRTWKQNFRQDKNHAQIGSLMLDKDEYLDMESYPELTIQSRGTFVTNSWKTNLNKQPIDASSGIINLTLDGNTLKKHVYISDDSETKVLGTPSPSSTKTSKTE